MKKLAYLLIFVLLIFIVVFIQNKNKITGKYYRIYGSTREYIEFTKDNKFSYIDTNGIIEEYNCNTYEYDKDTKIITLNCNKGKKELRVLEHDKNSITIKFHNLERTFKRVDE